VKLEKGGLKFPLGKGKEKGSEQPLKVGRSQGNI